MDEDSIFFFETFYLYLQIQNHVWDFTYHEHYSYFTVKSLDRYFKKMGMELIDVIRGFNVELKSKSNKMGFGFLDLYKLTDRGDGFSNNIWHLDHYHLSAEGMCEAWREYFCDSNSTITFQ